MYSPISLDYFLNMEVANGGISKQILNLNGKLKYVKDIIEYWKENPLTDGQYNYYLKPENWQYYNCMIAGFRHNVANHHDLGWENMTKEYYSSLKPMSDEEIEDYLEGNPVEFDNGFIKHSYHRAYAMIGRLIEGKSYIPFYMETEKIFNKPWSNDNKIRTEKPTSKIKLLQKLDEMGIDRNEYCLCQSSILSVMGIRDNDDLDIIISSKLRNTIKQWPLNVEVFPENYSKFDYFGATDDDDILENYCITIDGYKFLEPRFYFARKNNISERDKKDWEGIKKFFERESHLGYPFNFDSYKWGLPYFRPRIKSSTLDLESLVLVKDKYDRVVDGVNQGRVVYAGEGYYVKIFHPDYCRLQNFKDALSSGFLNGLAPALSHILEDDNGNINGYITLSGEMLSESEFDFQSIPNWFTRTVLRNCKKRNKIFYDFVPINIIRDSYYNEISLIDLESVYDIDDLDDMKKHNATIKPTNFLEEIKKI